MFLVTAGRRILYVYSSGKLQLDSWTLGRARAEYLHHGHSHPPSQCSGSWEHLLFHHLRHQSVCITKQVILIYLLWLYVPILSTTNNSTVAVCTPQHTCSCGILIVIAAILELQTNGDRSWVNIILAALILLICIGQLFYIPQTTHKTTNGKLMAKLFSHPNLIS